MKQTDLESALPAPAIPASAPRIPQTLSPVSPRICEIVFAALLLVLALAPASLLNSDGDAAQHLLAGRVILAQGGAPQQDLFSHAHLAQPFLDWEWGAEAIYAAVNALLGLNGVAILAAALITGTLYGLCRWMLARGLHPVPALVIGALAGLTSEIHWLARPHLFTFMLLLGLLWLLEEYRTGRLPARRLALIPPLFGVWANLHPQFVVGLGLCAAYAGAEALEWALPRSRLAALYRAYSPGPAVPAPARQARTYSLVFLAGAAATLINPYGRGLWTHIADYWQGSFTTRLIVEFQPPDLRQPITWPFLFMLAGMLLVLAWTWRRVPLAHLVVLAGWTYLSLSAARNIFQFALLVPALLAPQIVYLLGRARTGFWARYRTPEGQRLGVPWVFTGLLALLLLLAATGGRIGSVAVLRAGWTEPPFPVRAIRFLQTTPPAGKMFNNITWGGYLLYTLYPGTRVFISSQQDAYGDQLNRDYLTVALAQPGWEALLARYDIAWVIDPPGSPLVRALRAHPDRWQIAYADSTATILTRR